MTLRENWIMLSVLNILKDIEKKIDDLIHEMGESKELDSLKGVVGEKIREANEWVDNIKQSAITIQNIGKVESFIRRNKSETAKL